MREKFETLYIWAIGIGEYLGNLYIRFYPPLAFGYAIFIVIATENRIKTCVSLDDLGDILIVLLVLTIVYVLMSALWVILRLSEKLADSRPPRHYRREIDR